MLDISLLNEAQRSAVISDARSLLIIAGAGSGKTRTLIYRLAWLLEQGVSLHNMLLLTFTRKAAAQMVERASLLASYNMQSIRSGTFHAFAFSILRQHPEFCLRYTEKKHGQISVMDSADQHSCISHCKDEKKIAKGDRSFPKAASVISFISKSRNKEMSIEDVLRREGQHLLPYATELEELEKAYKEYKRLHGLYDYDDLLFELEELLVQESPVLDYYRGFYRHIMVDEYQDTNKVQARLVKLLAGEKNNVMVVGDDAQSIYAFRGATVRNILDFPQLFNDTQTVYLEENYRSYQPILDIANAILKNATEGYQKELFSNKNCEFEEAPVRMYTTLSDVSQAKIARQYIQDLLVHSPAREIVVLYRAGYQAYHLELELNKEGIDYTKVGGIKYTEAAHVKDFLAYAKLINNPQDHIAFSRIAAFAKGIGVKTAQKLYTLSQEGNIKKFEAQIAKYPDFKEDIDLINRLKRGYIGDGANVLSLYESEFGIKEEKFDLMSLLNTIFEAYKKHAENLYPEDYPRRLQGLEELIRIAIDYKDLDLFISDLVLSNSEEDTEEGQKITISTVHSAKGLEWDNVLIMDLVEDRFPSHHAMTREEDFEEERRLLYVATTRARKTLALFVPASLYQRQSGGFESAMPSPFLRAIDENCYDEYQEMIGGTCFLKRAAERYSNFDYYTQNKTTSKEIGDSFIVQESVEPQAKISVQKKKAKYEKYGYCQHKVFGRGKIIDEVDSDKYKINFQNIGVKTILKNFVVLEDI